MVILALRLSPFSNFCSRRIFPVPSCRYDCVCRSLHSKSKRPNESFFQEDVYTSSLCTRSRVSLASLLNNPPAWRFVSTLTEACWLSKWSNASTVSSSSGGSGAACAKTSLSMTSNRDDDSESPCSQNETDTIQELALTAADVFVQCKIDLIGDFIGQGTTPCARFDFRREEVTYTLFLPLRMAPW